jgi:hypothetical protein
MPVIWRDSADKHGVPREQTLYVIGHAAACQHLPSRPGEQRTVFVGHPTEFSDDWLVVIVATAPPRRLTVIHSMPLTDLFRYLLEEES